MQVNRERAARVASSLAPVFCIPEIWSRLRTYSPILGARLSVHFRCEFRGGHSGRTCTVALSIAYAREACIGYARESGQSISQVLEHIRIRHMLNMRPV
jgi:hypothetical protein